MNESGSQDSLSISRTLLSHSSLPFTIPSPAILFLHPILELGIMAGKKGRDKGGMSHMIGRDRPLGKAC